jgi:hypothetical protein
MPEKKNVRLSELSLEERMTYYREKYDKGGKDKHADRERKREKHGQRDQSAGRKAGKSTAAQVDTAVQAEAPETGKKGVLSRIAGIFRKK